MRNIIIHFDGSCWPNPGGTAAYGYTVSEGGVDLDVGHGVIGTYPETSNNVAEFYSLYRSLNSLSRVMKPEDKGFIQVYGDSQIVINIMNKKWRAGADKLYYPAYVLAKEELAKIRRAGLTIMFNWVPREKNQRADDLSKYHEKSL